MASTNMTRHVKQKASESEGEDRISNLPESILAHILSCLPTKRAVATCVLSKRWLYLWTYITTLHFDDREFRSHKNKKKTNNFENFVSSVLLHLNNSSIQSFSLDVARKLDPSLVNAWISAILKRGVKDLTISSPQNTTILFSHYLFSCNSLAQLILNISCPVRVPAFVHLPNLQNLQLCGLQFMGESSSTSKDMILSFPVLKKFKAKISWLNVHSVIFQVPLLEVVDINCVPSDYGRCTIKFCAVRLRHFSYAGSLLQYYFLSDPSSALNASACISIHKCENVPMRWKDLGLRACMLLRLFNQVKYLQLKQIAVFGSAKESFMDLPTFEMLHHLKLGCVTVEMLIALLLKTPNLITLDIEWVFQSDNEELMEYFAIVPDCLSTLKVVKFGNFCGYHNELCLTKYIMENAVELERLSFSPNENLRSFKRKKEAKEKLLSVMKGFNLTITDFSGF